MITEVILPQYTVTGGSGIRYHYHPNLKVAMVGDTTYVSLKSEHIQILIGLKTKKKIIILYLTEH